MAKVHGIILLVIAFLELLLALYILLQNHRDRIRRWYSFFIFSVSLWVWPIGLIVFINRVGIIEFISKLNWVGPIFIAPTLLFLSWIFPYKLKQISIKNWLVFLLPIFIFLILLFTPIFPILESANLDEWRTVNFGPGLHLFNAFFVIY